MSNIGFSLSMGSNQVNKGVTKPKPVPKHRAPSKPGPKYRICPNCQDHIPLDRRCGCESFELVNYNNNNNTNSVNINNKENNDPNNNNNVIEIDPCTTKEYLLLQKQYEDEKKKYEDEKNRYENEQNKYEDEKNKYEEASQKIEKYENDNQILNDEILKLRQELEETKTKDKRINNLEQRILQHKELSSVALLQVEELQQEVDIKNEKIEELKSQINEIINKNKSINDNYLQDIDILTKEIYGSLDQKNNTNMPSQEHDITDNYPISTVDLSDETLTTEGTSIEIDNLDDINTNNNTKDKQNVILLQSSNNSNNNMNELRKAFNILKTKISEKDKEIQNLKSNEYIIVSTNVELNEDNEKLKKDIQQLTQKLNMVTKSLNLATKEFTNYKVQYNEQVQSTNDDKINDLQKANANLLNRIEVLNIKQQELVSKFNEQLKDKKRLLDEANNVINSNEDELNKFRRKEWEEKNLFTCPMCKEKCKNEYSMIIESCGHKLCWRTKNDCVRNYAKNIYKQSKQPHCYVCKNINQKDTIIPESQLELILTEEEMRDYHKLVCLRNVNHNHNHNHHH